MFDGARFVVAGNGLRRNILKGGISMKAKFFLYIAQFAVMAILLSACGSSTDSSAVPVTDDLEVTVMMVGDRIAEIEMIRKSDGFIMLKTYPSGKPYAYYNYHNALGTADTSIISESTLTVEEFQRFMKEHISASDSTRLAAQIKADSSSYNANLNIGYDNSVGRAPLNCFNFNSSVQDANVESVSLSSENTASSISKQINTQDSMKMSFLGFKASDKFSYTDKSSSSTNSGAFNFIAYSIYPLQNTIDENKFLNQSYSSNCGSSYIQAVSAGMLIIGTLTYSSSSSQASSAISDTFKTSFLLEKLSAAVSLSSKVENSSTAMDFKLTIYGGGTDAQSKINSVFTSASTQTDLTNCMQGTASSCDSFVAALNGAICDGIEAFNQLASAYPLQTSLEFFAQFPNGIQGVTLAQFTTASIASIVEEAEDHYDKYKDEIQNSLDFTAEIATLYQRADALKSKIDPQYNPSPVLDIVSYLDPLLEDKNPNSYYSVFQKQINALTDCFQNPGDDTCTNPPATNPYNYYLNLNPPDSRNHLLTENTVALQYVGTYTDFLGAVAPTDIMYIDQLPPSAETCDAYWSGPTMVGNAALIAFTDQPYYPGGHTIADTAPAVAALAFQKGNYSMSNVMDDGYMIMHFAGIWDVPLQWVNCMIPVEWSTIKCTPTFDGPCSIGYIHDRTLEPQGGLQMDPITDLFE